MHQRTTVIGTHHTLVHDSATGNVTEQWKNKFGEDHRDDGPAMIVRNPSTGVIVQEFWCQNGELHRVDGPAYIRRDPINGEEMSLSWWKHGEVHRTDGPAITERDADTGAITLEWRANGIRQHRPQHLNRAGKNAPKP
jgi:hypothetical protein